MPQTNDIPEQPVDFTVENHGTVFVFVAQTERARELLENDVPLQPWQWLGTNTFAVEHGVARDLAGRFLEEGFIVA